MNIEEFKNALKKNVVVFEYKKKDGTNRIAKGTLNENILPDKEPDEFQLGKEGVDKIVQTQHKNFDEFMKHNKIEFVGETDDGLNYIFKHKKKTIKHNENIVSYYDIEKEEFRSFVKDNFIGVISVE